MHSPPRRLPSDVKEVSTQYIGDFIKFRGSFSFRSWGCYLSEHYTFGFDISTLMINHGEQNVTFKAKVIEQMHLKRDISADNLSKVKVILQMPLNHNKSPTVGLRELILILPHEQSR